MNIDDVLRALAEAGPRDAPPRVEAALRMAFRENVRRRRWKWITFGSAAALAAAAASVFVYAELSRPQPPIPAVVAHIGPPARVQPQAAKAVAVALPRPKRKRHQRPAPAREVPREFIALPYGDDALIRERATVMRVEMPRSAMRLVGFPVAEERANEKVMADVLLGPDGLARAVRFVDSF